MFLVSIFVLFAVCGVLADHRREHRRSRFSDHHDATGNVEYNDIWAGAVLEKDIGTFTTVTGKFFVPVPSGQQGTSASVWVGIDGSGCPGGLLQTGLDLWVDDKNETSSYAWYEWYPDVSYYWSNFTISPGDFIQATIITFNTTFGKAVVENLTRNQTRVAYLNSTYALCRQSAEWIVEDFSSGNGTVLPFANFSAVTFTDAWATGPAGNFTPRDAAVLDIQHENHTLTSVSINGTSVAIKYIDSVTANTK